MSELASAFVRIRPDTAGFKAEAERGVRSGLGGIGKIIGGAFAAVGLEEGVRHVAEAAASQQEELAVVRQSIRSTDAAWVVHGKTVSDTLRETAVKFGFTVSDLAQGFTRIQVSTKDSAKTFSLLDAAMDISRARHLSLAQAAVVVAKAQSGNVTGLQRLGIVIPKVTAAQDDLTKKHDEAVAAGAKFTKEQQLQYKTAVEQAKALDTQATKTRVLSEIQGRFGGQAATFARTAEGSGQRFREAVNELEVAVGNGLLPTLTSAASGATKFFKELADGGQVQAFAASSARELASGYRVVKEIAEAVAPPITAIAKAVGEVAHEAGGGSIVAFAVGFKAVSVSLGLAAAARAKYDAVVAAGVGPAAAEAAAAKTSADATTARTTAVVAGTSAIDAESVSLARNIDAMLASEAAAARVAAAQTVLAARYEVTSIAAFGGGRMIRDASGEFVTSTAKVDAFANSAERAGSKLGTIGRGLFTLAGGWTTVAALGLGAAAFGIYKLVTAEDDLDAANKRVTASTEALDRATQIAADTRKRLEALTAQIPQDKLAVAQANLNEQTAKNALLTTNAGQKTDEFRQLQLNLLQAIEQRRAAEKQLGDDQAARGKTASASEFADKKQASSERERVAAITALAAKEEEAAVRSARAVTARSRQSQDSPEGIARVAKARVDAARSFADRLDSDAEQEKNKTLRRNEELVAALARQTGKKPTAQQIGFILKNDDAKATLGGLLFALDTTVEKGRAKAKRGGESIGTDYAHGIAEGIHGGADSITDALIGSLDSSTAAARKHIGAHSPSEVARDQIGKPISDGIALGILDRSGAVVKAITSQVDDAIAAGVQAVRDAVVSAKQNLNSIGGGLAGDISTLLDKRGTTGSGQPTGAQAARLKELLARVQSGTADTETIKLAQQLSNQAVAKQTIAQQTGGTAEAITRKLADLTDLLNRGSINEKTFDARLDRIVRQAGATPGKAQGALGIAFADQLRADIAGLKEQAHALAESPRVKGSGLEPTIVRPLETIREQQRLIADAAASQRAQQLAEAKRQTAEAKRANKHLADIAAHTKGTATIDDINRWIKNAERHPKAAVDALVAAANRHGR